MFLLRRIQIKMERTFCKYYNLETENPQDVTNLEGELERRLLQVRQVRASENASVDEIAQDIVDGGGKGMAIYYDSGDFDVLYLRDQTIRKPKKQRKWIRKSQAQPGLYGIELVVKATPQDIIDLQNYLSATDLNVREARNVRTAIVNFSTGLVQKNIAKSFRDITQSMIRETFPSLAGDFKFYYISWGDYGRSGFRSTGYYSGPVEDVLKFRKNLINSGRVNNSPIECEETSFS